MKRIILAVVLIVGFGFSQAVQDTVIIKEQINKIELRYEEIDKEIIVLNEKVIALNREISKLTLEKVNIEYTHPILMELIKPPEEEQE